MATVILDIIEGSGLIETRDGLECERVFKVDTAEGDASGRLYAALRTSGVPQRGDAHPTIPGLRVDTRQASPESNDPEISVVRCQYRQLSQTDIEGATPSISVGTVVASETTSRDANGAIVATTETKARLDADGNVVGFDTLTRPVQVAVQRPMMTYHVTRKENASPEAKAQQYVGRAGAFNRQPDSAPNWLCTRIEGSSTDGGVTYDVDYEFTYNREGWDAKIETFRHKDVLTSGELVADVLRIQVYDVVSFSGLGLPAPSTVGVLL
jgi:hypothetical protein